MIKKIDNHVERAQDLLVSQFKDSENLNKIVKSLVDEVQEIEDSLDDLRKKRSLDTAEGVQLDGIGDIVDEERVGRSDIAYRLALALRIGVNISKGTPRDVQNFLKNITSATDVSYIELYPAKLQLYTNGTVIPNDLVDRVREIVPVSIGLIIVSVGSGFATSFGFAGDSRAGAFGSANFAEPSDAGQFAGVLFSEN